MAGTPRPTNELHAWLAAQQPLQVVPLHAPLHGPTHQVDSKYSELFWLPIIGPSALWVWRRVADGLTGRDTLAVPLGHLAAAVGLGRRSASDSTVVRTLARLALFDLAAPDYTAGTYQVRNVAPGLSHRQVQRLPEWLAAQHVHHQPVPA